jgi:hypothetical protein
MNLKVKITVGVISVFLMGLAFACNKHNDPAPPASNVHLKDGLLLYLPFDGNIADSSGNNNTTAAVNDPVLSYDEHGYSNSAFAATGAGQEVIVTNNGSIKFDTAFALSFNFTQTNPGLQTFLSLVNVTDGTGPTFSVGTTLPGIPFLNWGASDSTAGCDNSGVKDPNVINNTTSFIPQSGAWYNAVCIYHKATTQIYINGKLISTKTGTGSKAMVCPAAQLVVGGWWNYGDKENMIGKLDEIRLYNRTLNADEIAELSKDFQED